MQSIKEYFRGCLIGGALGDALGNAVEFMSKDQIIKHYGAAGISELVTDAKGIAQITDDTQMTIFTCEGLLRANTRYYYRGIDQTPQIVFNSYLRWLHTQGVISNNSKAVRELDGWVGKIRGLYARRAPGKTCITYLQRGIMGTTEAPINNSKGCGGVMRIAPVGLVLNSSKAFKVGCELAAITHGHPSGFLSAGAMAFIISEIIQGKSIRESVLGAMKELQHYSNSQECLEILKRAIVLADRTVPGEDVISQLGEGWVGEEALAIAVYCALTYSGDFKKTLALSVNHNGDSDSTGALTGNLLGAYLGLNNLPKDWVDKIEFRNELVQLADDLAIGFREGYDWLQKYPGW